jgi:hypothetical protein
VRIFDIPENGLDDYLALWALGTLFEKTRDIDMKFTRANEVLRILITCLDPTLIPKKMDVRMKDDFYRLRFEVDGLNPALGADVRMDNAPNGDGDMEHDGPKENDEANGKRSDSNIEMEQNDNIDNNGMMLLRYKEILFLLGLTSVLLNLSKYYQIPTGGV